MISNLKDNLVMFIVLSILMKYTLSRVKVQFGYAKVRYRGIAKNANRLYLLSGFANLLRVRFRLSAG